MSRGFKEDAILGKCTFCSQKIQDNDARIPSKYAKITFGRWICGSCLFGMKDAVNEVVDAMETEQSAESVVDVIKDVYKFDVETGKYVS